jgi:hypothetical protein
MTKQTNEGKKSSTRLISARGMVRERLFPYSVADQETINRLIESLKLCEYELKRIDRTYRIDPNRNGTVIILKDTKTGHQLKATIDFKNGKPSWEQMMDITFGIGEGSDIRIALYDRPDTIDDLDDNDEGEFMAKSFVSVLKGSGLKAHLVRMDVSLKDGRIPKIRFIPVCEDDIPQATFDTLPSKREFEQAEFWLVQHESFYPSDPPIVLDPSRWFGEIDWEWSGNPACGVRWDERGIVLHARFETQEDLEDLNWLWEKKRAEILDRFKACEGKIEKGENGDQSLVVIDPSIPFRNFVLAEKEEKFILMEEYLGTETEFPDFIVSKETHETGEQQVNA